MTSRDDIRQKKDAAEKSIEDLMRFAKVAPSTTIPPKATAAATATPSSIREDIERLERKLEERDVEAWKANIEAGLTNEPFEPWRKGKQRDFAKEKPDTSIFDYMSSQAIERLQGEREAQLPDPLVPQYAQGDEPEWNAWYSKHDYPYQEEQDRWELAGRRHGVAQPSDPSWYGGYRERMQAGPWRDQAASARWREFKQEINYPYRARELNIAQPSHPYYSYADEMPDYDWRERLDEERAERGLGGRRRGPGLQSPMRGDEGFMEESIYPITDEWGQGYVPQPWSPLLDLEGVTSGQPRMRWLDLWNEYAEAPRETRDNFVTYIKGLFRR